MANTFSPIASITVGAGGAATMEFTSIPQTYTDLYIVYSCRSTNTATNWNNMKLAFNSSTANGSWQYGAMYNNGLAANNVAGQVEVWINFGASTANTFSNSSVYINNYTSSNNKAMNIETVAEGAAQDLIVGFVGGLWSNSSAITAISVTPSSGNFAQYSTAYLYGIKNS
jgi:hypothetical protein